MIKQFLENGKTCFTIQAYGTDRYGKQARRRRVLKDVKRAAAVKLERELNLELAALKQGIRSKREQGIRIDRNVSQRGQNHFFRRYT